MQGGGDSCDLALQILKLFIRELLVLFVSDNIQLRSVVT